jgi:hypothetical protein
MCRTRFPSRVCDKQVISDGSLSSVAKRRRQARLASTMCFPTDMASRLATRIRRSSLRRGCRLTPKAVGWAARKRQVAMRLRAITRSKLAKESFRQHRRSYPFRPLYGPDFEYSTQRHPDQNIAFCEEKRPAMENYQRRRRWQLRRFSLP